MKRNIKKVAVLGSGVMGSRIACHFANIGCEVLLLDIVPRELSAKEQNLGLKLDNKAVRNRIVNDALKSAIKSNPSPIYSKSFVSRIQTGNFDDDLKSIASCDWTIEVVIENLDIKKQVYANVEEFRKPGTLITSNTSSIPMHKLIEGRSEDFKRNFCGSHFFNPPRYLRLLEIIPTSDTDPGVVDFLMDYGSKFLGKKTVLCKDTPGFIANRVGVFSIQALFHTIGEMGLNIETVDRLTGPAMGRPKSATFRTCDVVGIDTLTFVASIVKENCPNDERQDVFNIPPYLKAMVDNGWLGSKTGQGFYKKVKGADGKSEILALDLETLEYRPQNKAKFATLEQAKTIDSLTERSKVLYNGKDKAGDFYRSIFNQVFAYSSHRVPEISDELYKIDDAMKAGFAWEIGPFETWDAIGVESTLKAMEAADMKVSPWIKEMLDNGCPTFYRLDDGIRKYYDAPSKSYKVIPGQEDLIVLSNIPDSKIVWKNSGTTIKDIGDGILNIEFHTKMNTIGAEVIQGLNKAIDIAEAEYKGLVVSNEGQNFSAGANVGMIFMMAVEQEWDELNFGVKAFQDTMMRMRYCSVPTVSAPHNLTLGGACELSMHADKVVAHAETYIGLVEFGVGVIPGGGGTKEFALRTSDEFKEGDIKINQLRNRFLTVGQAKVATSAYEAFELGYLRNGTDEVIISRDHQLARAKQACIGMSDGYSAPLPRKDITVLGNEGLGIVYVGAHTMMSGNYISEHDQYISEKLGTVMCGGDLSTPTQVSEQYLLDLERKTFVELCMQRKTLERMQSLVQTGKILRN
jgi:3-hydroxyacyl-CoA dehydrogenase